MNYRGSPFQVGTLILTAHIQNKIVLTKKNIRSAKDLLRTIIFDLVATLTVSPNHAEMISILNERDVFVVCEKPLCSFVDYC